MNLQKMEVECSGTTHAMRVEGWAVVVNLYLNSVKKSSVILIVF